MTEEKKTTPRYQARCMLLQALYAAQINPQDSFALESFLLQHREGTSKIDVDYFRLLFTAITLEIPALDKIIMPFVTRPLSTLTPIEHAILWIGAYELNSRLDIPYRVSINEAIELAKDFGAVDSHKFINGVLDKVRKQVRQES